jgi:hypothetical protein
LLACRSVDTLGVFGGNGRVYSVAVGCPGGGRRQPIVADRPQRHPAAALPRRGGRADIVLAGSGGFNAREAAT